MVPTESLELIALYIQNMMLAFSMYLTLTFAFLAGAFVVGARLSRYEAVAISALYLFASMSTIGSLMISLRLVQEVPDISTLVSTSYMNPAYWQMYMGPILVIGILLSIRFLFNVRQQRGE